MKNKIKENVMKIKKIKKAVLAIVMSMAFSPVTVYAADDASSILSGMDIINQILIGFCTAAGVFVCIWAIIDIATGTTAHDTAQQIQGLKKLAGGLMMVGISVILNLLT